MYLLITMAGLVEMSLGCPLTLVSFCFGRVAGLERSYHEGLESIAEAWESIAEA